MAVGGDHLETFDKVAKLTALASRELGAVDV